MNWFDIIVVGGGVSGMSTVSHLFKKQSFKGTVALLEARDRLGGRVHTIKTTIDNKNIELGANWIHGTEHNPVFDYLVEKNVIDISTVKQDESYLKTVQIRWVNGDPVDSLWFLKFQEAYSEILNESEEFKDELVMCENSNKFKDSLGVWLSNKIKSWIEFHHKGDVKLAKTSEALFDCSVKKENCICGCHSLDDVSLRYLKVYEELNGGDFIIEKGYHSLVENLWNDIEKTSNTVIKNRFRCFLSTKVDLIEWPEATTAIVDKSSSRENSKIKVQCSNGANFECRHLVITLPVGYLKKHLKTLFKPCLPEKKISAIQRIGFGTVDKIFLEYSSKVIDYFEPNTNTIFILWNEDLSLELDESWTKKIYCVSCVTDHCLLVWLSGDQAITQEKLTDLQVNNSLTQLFSHIFCDTEFPRANNLFRSFWGTDELSLGSYSYIRVGSSPKDHQTLAEPIYLPGEKLPTIVFAGEATHSHFFSTVHGAFLSGQIASDHLTEI